MASQKAEKPVGTQLFGPGKKEPASKSGEGGTKGSSKAGSKKAAPKTQEPKKKARMDIYTHTRALCRRCFVLFWFYCYRLLRYLIHLTKLFVYGIRGRVEKQRSTRDL